LHFLSTVFYLKESLFRLPCVLQRKWDQWNWSNKLSGPALIETFLRDFVFQNKMTFLEAVVRNQGNPRRSWTNSALESWKFTFYFPVEATTISYLIHSKIASRVYTDVNSCVFFQAITCPKLIRIQLQWQILYRAWFCAASFKEIS